MSLERLLRQLKKLTTGRRNRLAATPSRLRVTRLEDRRLLDASFGIVSSGILMLDGFDAGDTLTISSGFTPPAGPAPPVSAFLSFALSAGQWDSGSAALSSGNFQLSADHKVLTMTGPASLNTLQIDGLAAGGGTLEQVQNGANGFQISSLSISDVDRVELTDTSNDFDTLTADVGRLTLVDADDLEIAGLETDQRATITIVNGDLTDSDGAEIAVGWRGVFQAHNVQLGDHASDSTNFNALHLNATGTVEIHEDSEMRVIGDSSGTAVTLSADGDLNVLSGVEITADTLQLTALGEVHFQSGSTVQIDIDGSTPGTEHSVVQTSESLTLNGQLQVSSSITPADGTAFTIIEHQGTDPITGTFAGLNEGGVVTADNGQQFVISYIGGDGNDVVLYAGTPNYAFAETASDVAEGSDGTTTTHAVVVNRSGNTAIASSVDVVIAAGTANSNDFTAQTVTLNFAAGQTTAQADVLISADAIVEHDETILLSLTGFTSGGMAVAGSSTSTITVQNDDTAYLSINNVTVNESAGTATFTITSSHASQRDLTVNVARGGTSGLPVSSSDVTLNDSSATIAGDGATLTTTVTVAIHDDLRVEGTERFTVNLSAAKFDGTSDIARVRLDDASGTGTIIDNDLATFGFQSSTSSIQENDTTISVAAELTIQASGNVGTVGLDRAVSFEVNHTSGTATQIGTNADFTYNDSTLTFQAADGSSFSQSVTVQIHEDILNDDNETVVFSLQNLVDGTLWNSVGQVQPGSFVQHTLTIVDDDNGSGAAPGDVVFDMSSGNPNVRIVSQSGNLEIWVGGILTTSRAVAEIDTLIINGGSSGETVTLDFTVDSFSSNIIVNAGGGDDVLIVQGPVGSTTINYDGGIGSDTIFLNGITGGSDYEVTYAGPVDPEGGTVLIDQSSLLTYSEVENNSLNISGISDLVLNFAGGDSNIQFTRLNATQTQVTGDSFTTTNFTSPADSLSINFTDTANYSAVLADFADDFNPVSGMTVRGHSMGGDIQLTMDQLGAFVGDLDVALGGGTDSVIFQNSNQTFSELTVAAETITATTAALQVTGVTTLDAGAAGLITLNHADHDFVGDVLIANAGDVVLVDQNSLQLESIALTGNLTATAETDLSVNGLHSSGGNVMLTSVTGSVLEDGGDADADIIAAGTVTIQAALTIGVATSDVFTTVASNPLEIQSSILSLTAGGDVAVHDVLGTTVTSLQGDTVFLSSSGDLDLSAAVISATNLVLLAPHGTIILPNNIAVSGDLRIEASDVTTVGGGPADLTATRILFHSDSSEVVNITAQQWDGSSLGSLTLNTSSNLELADLNGDLTALNVVDAAVLNLSSGAVVSQELPNSGTRNSSIQARDLVLNGSGTWLLDNLDNDVDVLAGNADGSIAYHDSNSLTIDSVATPVNGVIEGLASSGSDVLLDINGHLTVNAPLNADVGDLHINVSGNLSQSAAGAITAASLSIQQQGVVGDVTLGAAANDVDVISVTNAAEFGQVVFFDSDELTVGSVAAAAMASLSVAATSGIDTNAGNISITSDGTLTVADTIDAAHATRTDSLDESVTLISRNGDFVLLDNVVITTDEDPTPGVFDDITGDQLTIIAGSVSASGTVDLGSNVEIRTDGGVARQLAPRPTAFAAAPTSGSGSAFVTLSDAENMRSNLVSLGDGFLGVLDLVFGLPGEENLQVVIDWGTVSQTTLTDVTPAGNAVEDPLEPGLFRFDAADSDKVVFFIDQGGQRYLIPHFYEVIDLATTPQDRNGRQFNPNIIGVRFSVAQHSSINVWGDTVVDPGSGAVQAPPDFTAANPIAPVIDATGAAVVIPGSGLASLSSTDPNPLDEFHQQAAELPLANRFVTSTGRPQGLAEWEFIAGPAPGIVLVVPTPLPKLEIPRIEAPIESAITTEIAGNLSFGDGAASDAAIGTDVYLQIRRYFELDAAAEIVMPRITDNTFISSQETLQEFIDQNPELQDGSGYEVWLITETSGQRVERPIVKFEITGGRPGPATEELPDTFEPYELKELEFTQPPEEVPKPTPPSDAEGDPDVDVSLRPAVDSSAETAAAAFTEPDAAAASTVLAVAVPAWAVSRTARWKRQQSSEPPLTRFGCLARRLRLDIAGGDLRPSVADSDPTLVSRPDHL